jgi:hypothetical protein
MKTIYKYELCMTGTQTLKLPADAEILTIQQQGAELCAWVKLDTNSPCEDRTIVICGTGNPIEHEEMYYLSTVQMGSMVWHFFEVYA